jgi:Erythromycin esterase
MASRSVARRILRLLLLIFVVGPLSLVLLVGLGYIGYGWWAVGLTDEAHATYLRQHQTAASTPARLQWTAVFDSGFYRQNQLFLLGEPHGCAVPQEADLALLQHLNAWVGVRHYIAEIDPAQAAYFNEYLRTGDETRLRAVFTGWDGTAQWGNQDFYDKVRRIRTLNATLPVGQRIQFVGLDRVQDFAFFHRYFSDLLAALPADRPVALDSVGQALARVAAPSAGSPAVDSLVRRAGRAGQVLRQTVGLPDSIGRSLQTAVRNLTYFGPKRIRRDSVMALNLREAFATGELAPQEKLYGLWGLAHVLQKAPAGVPPQLAELAVRYSLPAGGRVVSIATVLLDSRMLVPTAGLPQPMRPPGNARTTDVPMSQDGPMVFIRGIKDVKAATQPHTVTLCRLDGPGSPYRTSQRLGSVRAPIFNQTLLPKADADATTDFFQYLLVVRNGAAVRPLTAEKNAAP